MLIELDDKIIVFTFLFPLEHLHSYLANKYASKKIILPTIFMTVKTKILGTIKDDLICYDRYN